MQPLRDACKKKLLAKKFSRTNQGARAETPGEQCCYSVVSEMDGPAHSLLTTNAVFKT
jgi:hypothetical protein